MMKFGSNHIFREKRIEMNGDSSTGFFPPFLLYFTYDPAYRKSKNRTISLVKVNRIAADFFITNPIRLIH